VLIVVGLVLAQDLPQMGLVPDQGAVQELAPASPDPASGYRVHAGRRDVAEHGPDPGPGEDHVGRGGEVRAAVADHELDLMRLPAEVGDQVAGLLGGPFPRWMQRDGEDADAPGGVLDHGQNIGLGAAGQAGREQATPRIASAWQRANCGQAGSVRRGAGSIPAFVKISHTVGAASFTPRPASAP
jgi:hypothetical protein